MAKLPLTSERVGKAEDDLPFEDKSDETSSFARFRSLAVRLMKVKKNEINKLGSHHSAITADEEDRA